MRRRVYRLQSGVFNIGLEGLYGAWCLLFGRNTRYDVMIPGFMAVMYNVVN